MVDQRCNRRWYLAAPMISLPPTAESWRGPRPVADGLEIHGVCVGPGREARRLRLDKIGVANRLDSCLGSNAACATFSIEVTGL
jgi:hypothetical protein